MNDVALAHAGPRVVILGDSWIRGLGTGKKTFGRMIAKEIGASETLDLSAISRTAPDVVHDHLPDIEAFAPQVAILCVGGADSLIFPAWTVQRAIDRIAPKKWQGTEGMMPLARYSRDRWRRARQRIEQTLKVVIKQILINLFGGRRRVSIPDLEEAVTRILDVLDHSGCHVIAIGFAQVDGWYSPKANASVAATNALMARLVQLRPRAIFVPTDELVHHWNDYLPDHVHLNMSGHKHLTDGVLAALRAGDSTWRRLVEAGRPSDPTIPISPAPPSRGRPTL